MCLPRGRRPRLLFALSGCGDDAPEVKTGQWGGLGTELNVTGSGASVLLCCNSTGVIQEPLVPDAAGNFKARGTVFQQGLRADYEGTVSGRLDAPEDHLLPSRQS